MLLTDIDPFVRQALVGNLDKNNVNDVNTKIKSVDCRLFYVISGGGRMIIENVPYALTPGTTVLFSAGTEYMWEIVDVKYYVVNFDYTRSFSHIKRTFHPIRSELFTSAQMIERPYFENCEELNRPIVLHGVSAIGHTVSQIITEYCIGGAHCDALLGALMKSAIVTALRISEKENGAIEGASSETVRRAVSYINHNFDRNISNTDIAAELSFNSVYLNRIFKAHTGESLHSFLISRRIEAAMEMLRSQDIPVGEVAKKCGFSSLFHFTKCFKLRTGMSPSDYRRLGT